MPIRECKICGELFETKSSKRSFCYKSHYHPCPVCGKDVLTKDLYHLNECCCKEHSRQLAIQTTHERFEDWPTNSEEAKAKRKQTSIERYGVDNPSKNEEIKQKVSEGLHRRYAIDGDDIRKRAQETYFERTGYHTPSQNPAVQSEVRQRNKEKYGYEHTFQVPEFKDKSDATNLERYGSIIPMQNPEIWHKQRHCKSTYVGCDGTPLDSTYEVFVYNYCIRNNIPIKRTSPISFEYEGKEHKTFIDFEIDGLLVEVKGEHILDGYFDLQPNAVPMEKKLEVYKKNNVIVVTGESKATLFKGSFGLHYIEENKENPLIGVDIELFKNPGFPYAEDRPECFYNVSVNGCPSCFDAFNNEKIRWDMIKNRIKYVGGFIAAKQILTALNVTRKAKQPSWFSLTFARDILSKYSNSDVIVDPFAGWGTRYDASVALNKTYIGCDLNSELVEWHQKLGRSITLHDARQFKYDGECNVFICPPYRDTEIYFKGQDVTTTECQWLDIVRKNVPNASRYIMVCKAVDPQYRQYIVETKENKSHFGKNTEYVLVVDNLE